MSWAVRMTNRNSDCRLNRPGSASELGFPVEAGRVKRAEDRGMYFDLSYWYSGN